MRVGLQLFTVRDQLAADWRRALRRVAEAGYEFVEFAGHPFTTVDAGELRSFLQSVGLKPVSASAPYQRLREDPDPILSAARELGLSFIMTEPDVRGLASPSDVRRLGEEMSEVGLALREKGLRMTMHNHAVQFQHRVEGRPVYWLIVESTDPRYVFFEPDTFWIKFAGFDPVEVISRLRGRCPLVHLKDMRDERTREMEEVGAGVIDFRSVLRACAEAGVEYGFVEHDSPRGDSIEAAARMLSRLKGLMAQRPA